MAESDFDVRELLEERGKHYGDARKNFQNISEVWSAYLGFPVSPDQVAMCMILLKIMRSIADRNHIDNYDDIVGYATLIKEKLLT